MLEALRKEFIPTFSGMSLLDDSLLTQTPGRHRKHDRKDHNSRIYKNTTLTEVKITHHLHLNTISVFW